MRPRIRALTLIALLSMPASTARADTMRIPSATRGLGWLVAAAIAGLLTGGCSATATPTPSEAAQSSAFALASTTPLAQATPTSTAGPGTLTCTPLGASTPRFTVVAPAGWSAFKGECGFVVAAAEPLSRGAFTAGLSAWIVGQVPTNPCQNQSTLTTPGETVGELVQALVAQELRNATAPVDVTLAGYEGKYLEWSVPTDIVVLDEEFHVQGCDDGNFLSWLGRAGGTRYQQVGGQVDQLWLLDVDGQTVVIDASYAPDAPERVRDELAEIVRTLEFEAR
jgi:hypothetical protein